jgi:hypothetical protein
MSTDTETAIDGARPAWIDEFVALDPGDVFTLRPDDGPALTFGVLHIFESDFSHILAFAAIADLDAERHDLVPSCADTTIPPVLFLSESGGRWSFELGNGWADGEDMTVRTIGHASGFERESLDARDICKAAAPALDALSEHEADD